MKVFLPRKSFFVPILISFGFAACVSAGSSGPSGQGGSGSADAGSGGLTGSQSGGRSGSGSGGTTAGTGGMGGLGGSLATGGTSGTGGATSTAFTCPPGPFPSLQLPTTAPVRIPDAPPTVNDTFNNNGNNFTIVEGPVWIGDALYVSEIGSSSQPPPPSRVIKITATDAVTIAIPPDSGSNGLAVDRDGALATANHGAGGIVKFNLTTGARSTVIAQYNGSRFNSPNDLTIRSDGTIYFSDPAFQAPNPQPQQGKTWVYMLPPNATTAMAVAQTLSNPNGVTLSLDEKTLYIGDGGGVRTFGVHTDGTLDASGIPFGGTAFSSGATDGMAIDCAGNLYVVRVNSHDIVVLSPSGQMIGSPITVPGGGQITNSAFGGTDHKTLYITAMGTGTQRGVFKLAMPIPGMPY